MVGNTIHEPKLNYRIIAKKTMMLGWGRHIDHWSSIEDPEISPQSLFN